MLLQAQSIAGIVNRYAAVTSIDTCLGALSVSDTSGFKKGDAVLLIQMQGASISSANNSSYGNIQALNSAGRYERAVLDSVGPGTFFVRNQLLNRFNPAGKVQAVRIAVYQSATVTDTIFPQPWNGQTGGIVALEVTDSLVMHAPVVADGAGFRGGAASIAPGNNCNFLIPETGYFYASGNWRGSNKGEGIAAPETGKELGRGPQANGGGGGNDHNAGGGGGANAGRGGSGGNNDEPSSFGCDGYYPGLGAYQTSDDSLRLFLGGGGGAGHANNTLGGSGGSGGGIILIRAGVISGDQPIISANGRSTQTADGDGGGGGGAGGSIRLEVTSMPQNVQLHAGGGNGGNTSNNNGNRCFGPGGGGGGGRILTNVAGVSLPAGGSPGIVTNSTGGCSGSTNDAGAGQSGRLEPIRTLPEDTRPLHPEILQEALSDTVCVGAQTVFFVQTNSDKWNYQWQFNDGTGWTNIGAGPGFSGFDTDTLVVNNVPESYDNRFFRVLVSRPGCFEITGAPAFLRVAKLPAASFEAEVNEELAVFTNTSVGGDSYHWDFGDGQSSEEIDPQHSYADEGVYTVTLTVFNACDTVSISLEINILLLPNAAFSIPDSIQACGDALVNFVNQASENATSFLWLFPGGMPEFSSFINPFVGYAASGEYPVTLIVTNNAGSDTMVQILHVEILGFPAAQFTYTILPNGVVEFVNTSATEAGFIWDFGDGSPALEADSAVSHTYQVNGIYTVTLVASNICGASVFQQMIEVNTGSVGTNDLHKTNVPRLYPNPAKDYLMVDCTAVNIIPEQVRILDLTGRVVLVKNSFSDLKTTISLHELPAGAYWVELRAGTQVWRRLVVKG